MSINGIGRVLAACEEGMRKDGFSERAIAEFRCDQIESMATALPFTSKKRRLEIVRLAREKRDETLRALELGGQTTAAVGDQPCP
jgi:hypothetical protein